MNEDEPANDRVIVSDQPVADFSHLTAPEQLAAISRIENVALVIVPESLAAAYAAIPSSQVAAATYVPQGANVRVHTGALVVGGDGIGADDELIITGMLIITSPVTGPVPQRIQVIGPRATGPHHRRVRGHPGRRWTGKLSSAASTRHGAARCIPTSPAGPATHSLPPS